MLTRRWSGAMGVSMTDPVLYSFRRCPYAMRARLALAVSGTACELREVKLSAKPQAMLDASPKGTVPVFVLPDGKVIDESIDIMHWAATNIPTGTALTHSSTARVVWHSCASSMPDWRMRASCAGLRAG